MNIQLQNEIINSFLNLNNDGSFIGPRRFFNDPTAQESELFNRIFTVVSDDVYTNNAAKLVSTNPIDRAIWSQVTGDGRVKTINHWHVGWQVQNQLTNRAKALHLWLKDHRLTKSFCA